MRTPGSLRARVLLGTSLWTLGLFLIFGLVLTQALFRHPSAPGVFHRLFLNVWPLAALAAACLAVGLLHVRSGLGSFGELHARLAALRAGRERRLEGPFTAEVQPLVIELNGLLADREQRVTRAMAAAGDLAHGLKTPLAVLTHVAGQARAAGKLALADGIATQVERMRRQVDYQLAQARASASGGRCDTPLPIAASTDGLVRTMRTIHAARALDLTMHVPDTLLVGVARHDFDEMLGNLLDNACKWACTRVVISAAACDTFATVVVDDDGPGIAPALREAVLRRGVRADEAAPGSGLGLAIVRDLVELYGGGVALSTSALGGLRAELTLPASVRPA